LGGQPGRDTDFLRGNMNLLAAKVGALQAKLVSIDGLGQRVAKVAGVAYTDPELAKQLAVAQPEALTQPEATQVMDDLFTDHPPPSAASAEALGRQLDEIQARLAQQSDNLKLLDAALTKHADRHADHRLPLSEFFVRLAPQPGDRPHGHARRAGFRRAVGHAYPGGLGRGGAGSQVSTGFRQYG
jgi:hypothetical protein